MQITVSSPEDRNDSLDLTLKIVPDVDCSLCQQRQADWFADPASSAAMNPSSTVLHSGEACTPCLNVLMDEGVIVILAVSPDAF